MTDCAVVFVDGNNQRRFLTRLAATDKRISYYLGRLEPRKVPNEGANELLRFLKSLRTKCDQFGQRSRIVIQGNPIS